MDAATAEPGRTREILVQSWAVTGRGAGDGIGVDIQTGERFFVPGTLPCGECPACRRALTFACRASTSARPPTPVRPWSARTLPQRFLVPIDLPGVDPTPSTPELAAVGLLAEALGASASAGAGPGDTAVWLGRGPLVAVGAAWTSSRGLRSFVSRPSPRPVAAPPATPPAADVLQGTSGSWAQQIADAEGAAGVTPPRRIFVVGGGPETAAAAARLAGPDATIVMLDGAPDPWSGLGELAGVRLLLLGGYHPDLVTEALAAWPEHAELMATLSVPDTDLTANAVGPTGPWAALTGRDSIVVLPGAV